MPDENAIFIAEVKQAVVFIHTSAPAANHVAVEVVCHVNHFLVVLFVTAVQAVNRHPVGSVNEYALAVDIEREIAAFARQVVHRVHVEAHGAQTDALVVGRQHSAVFVEDLQLGIIESRLTIAFWPPEVSFLKIHAKAECGRADFHSSVVCHLAFACESELESGFVVFFERNRQLHVGIHPGAVSGCVNVGYNVVHIADTCRLDYAEFHVFPQSGTHKAWHDVPAIHVWRFARPHTLVAGKIAHTVLAEKMVLTFHDCRADNYLEFIFAVLFHEACNVESVLYEHILGFANVLTVEPDVGKAVDTAKEELVALSIGKSRRGERLGVAPLRVFPLAQLVGSIAHHRVVNQSGFLQVDFHIARHGGRNCLYADCAHVGRRSDGLGRLLPVR